MAKELEGVIDEDTPLGGFGVMGDGDEVVSQEHAIPDLDIGEDVAAKPAAIPGASKLEKPDTEVRLPWDPKLQKADHKNSKLEKRLAQAEHVIEELRAKNAPPSGDEAALADAIKALETFPDAPELPGEFDTDEEREAYRKEMTKRDADIRRLTGEVKTLTAKVRSAKPAKAEKPAGEPDADEPGSMQEDFMSLCRDAEIDFGSEHGDKARPLIVKELGTLGFNESKPATKDQLAKVVTRIYRKLADSGKEQEVDSQPPTARREPQRRNLPPGRIYRPTIKELANQMRAEQARGHRKTQ